MRHHHEHLMRVIPGILGGRTPAIWKGLCWATALFLGVGAPALPTQQVPGVVRSGSSMTVGGATDETASQAPKLYVFGSWLAPASREFRKNVLWSLEFINFAVDLRLEEVDVDARPETAEAFAVTGVPTLVLATDEGKIIARHLGGMDPRELIEWIKAGRQRMSEGVWEGTARTPELSELLSRAEAGTLTTNELGQLVSFLGSPDPAIRVSAARALATQREAAMDVLIEAAGDPYLGTRINAGELLESLAPGAPVPSPWLSRDQSLAGVIALKEWWKRVGKLPPFGAPAPLSADNQSAIQAAIAALLEDNPARRTEAMSRLVEQGSAALPAVRTTIRRREQAGDERALLLLEDVRWGILVPDELERRYPGIRRTLARGLSRERQDAAATLARAGGAALPALVELASDTDPLVVESALGSLSATGGADAITAMTALLRSPDANLRLTAAQSLGRSKDSSALVSLRSALADADELVVVTALGAIEELMANEASSSKKTMAPELVAAISQSLQHSRWRVRAAAAEVSGKLALRQVEEPLKRLLNDPDGFVVKNALGALNTIGAKPEPEDLLALARRMPSLRGDVIEVLLSFPSAPAVRVVDQLYTQGSSQERRALLGKISDAMRATADESSVWGEIVLRSVTDPAPEVRRAGAGVLPSLPYKVSASLVEKFLEDEDSMVATIAAGTVIGLIAGRPVPNFEAEAAAGLHYYSSSSLASRSSTVQMYTTNQLRAWNTTLQVRPELRTNVVIATAAFLTSDGTNSLDLVNAALKASDAASQGMLGRLGAVGLILSRTQDEAAGLIGVLQTQPVLYAQAVSSVGSIASPSAKRLADPVAFLSVAAAASGTDQQAMIETLMARNALSQLERLSPGFTLALAASTNSLMRTVAVNALGDHGTNFLGQIEAASNDPVVWVRLAALRSIARITSDPELLRPRLVSMLSDADLRVARLAAVGLLEPEVRTAMGYANWLNDFQFENLGGISRSYSYGEENQRPLTQMEGKPEWLQQARQQYLREPGDANAPFAILLAQYGDYEALDDLIAQWKKSPARDRMDSAPAITTGIALSRDARYVPDLHEMLAHAESSWERRAILQGLRGMTGSEARKLRVEINRQLREETDP